MSLMRRWRSVRDRLLQDPSFQSLAARFPVTRWVARRRARQLFDLCAGFVYSQVLLACVRLSLFEAVAAGPRALADLARSSQLDQAALDRLVRAAVSLDLLEWRGAGMVGLGPHGAALLGYPGLTVMIEHHALLYDDLRDPVALLRSGGEGTRLGAYWRYTDRSRAGQLDSDMVADYSALMRATQPMVASAVLDAYPFRRHRRLLDVGGGEGAFVSAVAERAPGLDLMLFDLPGVAERARDRLAGLGSRVTVHGGSFVDDPVPTGADLITLVRVLYDHDDETVLALLRAVHAALPPGGTVLVAEPMAGLAGAEPIGDAYFGFYLVAMRGGRPRDFAAHRSLLSQAGFRSIRRVPTKLPVVTGVISARKPEGP